MEDSKLLSLFSTISSFFSRIGSSEATRPVCSVLKRSTLLNLLKVRLCTLGWSLVIKLVNLESLKLKYLSGHVVVQIMLSLAVFHFQYAACFDLS